MEALVRNSALVVLHIGFTPGVVRELERMARVAGPERLLLLLPFTGMPGNWRASVWRRFVESTRGLLPTPLPERIGRALAVRFGAGWAAEPVRPSLASRVLEVLTLGLHSRLRTALWRALARGGYRFRRLTWAGGQRAPSVKDGQEARFGGRPSRG